MAHGRRGHPRHADQCRDLSQRAACGGGAGRHVHPAGRDADLHGDGVRPQRRRRDGDSDRRAVRGFRARCRVWLESADGRGHLRVDARLRCRTAGPVSSRLQGNGLGRRAPVGCGNGAGPCASPSRGGHVGGAHRQCGRGGLDRAPLHGRLHAGRSGARRVRGLPEDRPGRHRPGPL